MQRSNWPVAARNLADAAESALAAAGAGDRDGFEAALGVLARADREQVTTLLGTAVVEQLQRAHPDGLDAAAAEALLAAVVAAARPWYPPIDDDLLVRALAGALDLGSLGDERPAEAVAMLAHGVLLLAQLLDATGTRPRTVIESAMAELIRAQTVEMP